MNRKLVVIMCVFLLSLVSCEADYYASLARSYEDPVVVPPRVISFQSMFGIHVEWDSDEAADEYILERKSDDLGGSQFTEVYRGKGLLYDEVLSAGRYKYRLKKYRGVVPFGPSREILGVASNVLQDLYEPNDTQDTAVYFETSLLASQFYYRAVDGSELSDIDWYCISLPPKSIALISLNDIPLQGESKETRFSVLYPGRPERPLYDTNSFELENDVSERRLVYFAIIPNKTQYSVIPGGGTSIDYKLLIESIQIKEE